MDPLLSSPRGRSPRHEIGDVLRAEILDGRREPGERVLEELKSNEPERAERAVHRHIQSALASLAPVARGQASATASPS